MGLVYTITPVQINLQAFFFFFDGRGERRESKKEVGWHNALEWLDGNLYRNRLKGKKEKKNSLSARNATRKRSAWRDRLGLYIAQEPFTLFFFERFLGLHVRTMGAHGCGLNNARLFLLLLSPPPPKTKGDHDIYCVRCMV